MGLEGVSLNALIILRAPNTSKRIGIADGQIFATPSIRFWLTLSACSPYANVRGAEHPVAGGRIIIAGQADVSKRIAEGGITQRITSLLVVVEALSTIALNITFEASAVVKPTIERTLFVPAATPALTPIAEWVGALFVTAVAIGSNLATRTGTILAEADTSLLFT